MCSEAVSTRHSITFLESMHPDFLKHVYRVVDVLIDFYLSSCCLNYIDDSLEAGKGEVHRSSHRRRSVKRIVLKNFANFTGKRLCWSLFLIKLQAFRRTTLLKGDSNLDLFLVKFAKFL